MKTSVKLYLIGIIMFIPNIIQVTQAQDTMQDTLEIEVEQTEEKLDSIVNDRMEYSEAQSETIGNSENIDTDQVITNDEDEWNEINDYQDWDKSEPTDDWDKTEVTIGKNFVKVQEKDDTVRVKIGNKGIKVIENNQVTKVDIIDLEDMEGDEGDDDFFHRSAPKFKGHLSGMDIGINNFVDKDFSLVRKPGEKYMDLNTGKSWNVNIHFVEQNIGLYKDRVGLVTGLGVEFSNYFFDNNNSIAKNDSTGFIESFDYDMRDVTTEKSKLTTTYLTLPLLLEVQLLHGKKSKRLFISGGVVGGVKLSSHTKVVYREDGDKKKDKEKGDFNIASLRYGYSARVGYKGLNVYGTYYPISLFENDEEPELYPFAIGLSFSF